MANAQKNDAKTGIIIAVIVGVFLIVMLFLGLGIGIYYFYKTGTESTPIATSTPTSTKSISTSPSPQASKVQDKTDNWQTYINQRFGFIVKAPADFDKFEAQNNDGVAFSHPDAVAINVFGAHNSEGLSLKQYLDKEYSQLQMETPDVKETANNQLSLDGCQGERRVWKYSSPVDGVKTTYEKAACLKNDVFYALELICADSSYSKYADVFNKVVLSFKFK